MAYHKLCSVKDNLRNISVFFVHTMKVIGKLNSFVSNSLQNTFFYIPQKKGLKRHEGEQMTKCKTFWLNIPFSV